MRTARAAALLFAGFFLGACVSPASRFESFLSLFSDSDAGCCGDAGIIRTDGGWVVKMGAPLQERFAVAGVHTLGEAGELTGDTEGSAPDKSASWIYVPETNEFRIWDIEAGQPGNIYIIRALLADGRFCGSTLWREGMGASPIPIKGDAGGFVPIMPLTQYLVGGCIDINHSNSVIVSTGMGAYFGSADGGLLPFNFYPRGPPFDDFHRVKVNALNESNEVVGYVGSGEDRSRGYPVGFYWSPDAGPTQIDNGPYLVELNDINNKGEMVGLVKSPTTLETVPAYWARPHAKGIELPLPEGMISGEALAINDIGLIVGIVVDENVKRHGALWYKGKAYLVDDIVGDFLISPSDELRFVNNRNRVVGDVISPANRPLPFYFDILQLPE